MIEYRSGQYTILHSKGYLAIGKELNQYPDVEILMDEEYYLDHIQNRFNQK